MNLKDNRYFYHQTFPSISLSNNRNLIVFTQDRNKSEMPFIKYPSFKTAISPSAKSRFDPENLTGTQKLALTSSRIFGFRIGNSLYFSILYFT